MLSVTEGTGILPIHIEPTTVVAKVHICQAEREEEMELLRLMHWVVTVEDVDEIDEGEDGKDD